MSERESNGIMVCAGSRSAQRAVHVWILGLTTLAALVFVLPGSSRAQSQSTESKSVPAGAATSAKIAIVDTATVTQAATAKPAAEAAAPTAQSAPKGQHEGITVHGYWTIDVKNPDGSLVRHVEFENSIDPGFPLSYTSSTGATPSGTQNVPGGAAFLSAILNGQAASNADNWGILLVGPAGLVNLCLPGVACPVALSNTTNAPCITRNFGFPPSTFAVPLDACILLSPSASNNYTSQQDCPNNTFLPGGIPGVSCNLASVALGTAPNLTGFQLSGSVTATSTGEISTVATVNFLPCQLGSGNPPSVVSGCAFSQGGGGNLISLVSLTSSTNFPGAPVAVTPGQTVAVNVAISFQ
jgi:hypothetical protein